MLWAHQIEVKHPTKDEQVLCSVQTPNEYPWTLFKENKKVDAFKSTLLYRPMYSQYVLKSIHVLED